MYATAQFFAGTKDGKKPAFLNYATGESNLLPAVKKKIHLNDIRTLTIQPTLQSHGFQRTDFSSSIQESTFLKSSPAGPSSSDATSIYYHECESLIRSLTGATTVHAFHHRYRQQKSSPTADTEKVKIYTTTPVPDIHIDNDASTAHAHLSRLLPEAEVARWTAPGRHWAIVNVWRPLAPVHQMPLALLDPSSTPIHMTGLAEPVYTRGNYKTHIRGLKWHPEYKFYYASAMGEGEALLFVDFDSRRRWRLGGVAHGAVQLEGGSEGRVCVPLRRSVEVRCLALYD
ncbi:hypothetical protein DPSP01_002981 [Paraphaeosphaeria sporulosa]